MSTSLNNNKIADIANEFKDILTKQEQFQESLQTTSIMSGADTLQGAITDVYASDNGLSTCDTSIQQILDESGCIKGTPLMPSSNADFNEPFIIENHYAKLDTDYAHLTKRQRTITTMPVRDSKVNPKIGRNEPCICGSGKKYKNCCGK